jgi:hypothetical protein
MSQGSRNNTPINLDDDLIGQRLAKPQVVQLVGREWSIRRDLDAEEIYQFWAHIAANDGAKAFALLLTVPEEEAKGLDERLQKLPAKMYIRKIDQIIKIAGLKRGDEPEDKAGESSPSSTGS